MNFESKLTKGEFCIPECIKCKKIVWPPSEFCNSCFGDVVLKEGPFMGKILEFSSQNQQNFCLVEFENTIRIMAKILKKPKLGQAVKISKCGISDGSYFFEVI
ncbi:MAG: hypothetical protein K5777_01405 [Nitrosopumilus sp.]|nr:hypothetical protein [Nitrosopumilus sp.]